MTANATTPVTVYGSSISYFTGKLENYLRIKGVDYTFKPMLPRSVRPLVKQEAGTDQIPALQLADGRWLTDTTPIIQWFEQQMPEPAVIPADPVQRFFSLLIEDYADEWLWRPAMHYRWYYMPGARFASTHLAHEFGRELPLPQFLIRRRLIKRQRDGYTTGDGITEDQVGGVEDIFLRTLMQLESILSDRPFLLGDRPSLADVGFAGPFFRHFGLDPVPAEIVKQQAPGVFAWMGRLWNGTAAVGAWGDDVPPDWDPILEEVGRAYLPYLNANVDAVTAGTQRFDATVDGVRYSKARWAPYRVWCLAELRRHFELLPDAAQITVRERLQATGCWDPLWAHEVLPLAPGFCERLPFRADAKMIAVYE